MILLASVAYLGLSLPNPQPKNSNMLHRYNVREWEWEEMGKALRESHGNGNWLQNWEWECEGMGIDCTGMGGSGNVKSHSRPSLGGTLISQVFRRLHVCRAADTVTDWRQEFHGSWSAAMEKRGGRTPTLAVNSSSDY